MPSVSVTSAVPAFYLYGEPQQIVTEDFVHVEDLDERSRPSEWTIRPHVHRHLNHLILIADGGGAMHAEATSVGFEAPSLLLIPAGVIHGFSWHSESRGWVTTIADNFLHHLLSRDRDVSALFDTPSAIALPRRESRSIGRSIKQLARELALSAPGQRSAMEALLLSILVQALRQATTAPDVQSCRGNRADLVTRLRARIDQRFRQREPVAVYAKALGVSETSLRRACLEVVGNSPAALLDERTLLEARRLLFYSHLSVSEVGYAVGFEDAAYFSRFFARHLGESPRSYRERQEKGR